MSGTNFVTGKVQSRLLCLILCYSLALTGMPTALRGGSSRSATPQQGGQRTTGAPSPNAPNIDAIRAQGVRRQDGVKLPNPTPAKRCRHWDKRCRELKEKKAENRFAPDNSLKGLIAFNHRAPQDYLDWRLSQAELLPELDFLFRLSSGDVDDSTAPNKTFAADANPLHRPRAFAASLIPPAAMQATNFETARVEPRNRTGRAGEDLLSGNYHWSLPLVSLPGRAGHDLNLTLAYNSLVWTKSGSVIRFDMDYGWPGPGFRFGFPVFYGPYVNSTTSRQAYIVITPSGEAVEMRKVTGYETYEAEDSSFLRLKFDTTLRDYPRTVN